MLAENVNREAEARPWYDPAADDGSGWSHYAMWERWMAREWDGKLPDNWDSAFDQVGAFERAFLYSLMCDLADGAFAAKGAPRA